MSRFILFFTYPPPPLLNMVLSSAILCSFAAKLKYIISPYMGKIIAYNFIYPVINECYVCSHTYSSFTCIFTSSIFQHNLMLTRLFSDYIQVNFRLGKS